MTPPSAGDAAAVRRPAGRSDGPRTKSEAAWSTCARLSLMYPPSETYRASAQLADKMDAHPARVDATPFPDLTHPAMLA